MRQGTGFDLAPPDMAWVDGEPFSPLRQRVPVEPTGR